MWDGGVESGVMMAERPLFEMACQQYFNICVKLDSGNKKYIFSTRERPLDVFDEMENFPVVLVATKPDIFNRRETAVSDSITTAFRVKTLDVFDEMEHFQAVFVATKPDIFNPRQTAVSDSITTAFRVKPLDKFDELSGNLPDVFVATKADIFNQRETAVWEGMSIDLSEITGYFRQYVWVFFNHVSSNKNRCSGQCTWIISSWKLGHFVQHWGNIQRVAKWKNRIFLTVIRWF